MEQHSKPATNPWRFALSAGLFAGFFWGAVRLAAYLLKFTNAVGGFWLEPFARHPVLQRWPGQMLGWLLFVLFSVLAAELYVWLFRTRAAWFGMGYGLFWWAVLFLLAGPLAGMMPPWKGMGTDTLVTEACILILWGLTIGYSITFEFNEMTAREPFFLKKSFQNRRKV